jgi:putative glutamine amidotransferase
LRRHQQLREDDQGEPVQIEIALGLAYTQAVFAGGGIPVILTPVPEKEVGHLLSCLSGVVLSGGPDIHPSAYGEKEHTLLGDSERELDKFELCLCAHARAAGVPVLGICRGLQIINVAAGGTLHQHLPDVVGTEITHRQGEAARVPTHEVKIEVDTALAEMLDVETLRVNSFHHQAIAELGTGLRAAAYTDDGLIEAIEGEDSEWLFAVQWHAESLISQPRGAALFEALVAAAREHDQLAQ